MRRRAKIRPIGALLTLGLTALLTLPTAAPASGQDGPPQASPGGAVIGGIAGGAFGFFVGAHLGATGDCYEICSGIIYGALGGQVLGVPLGAHVGNSGRGNLGAGLLASLVSVGLGVAATWASSDGSFYIASMVAQVAVVAATEIKTSPGVSVSAGPRLIGDEIGVGVSIQW